MNRSRIVLIATVALLMTPVLTADSGSICVAPGENAIVDVKATSDQGPAPKVYFNADESPIEHFVEMRRSADQMYQALLPKVEGSVTRINFRV